MRYVKQYKKYTGEKHMDERLKEIVDNYDKLKIGIDDEFKFSCKQFKILEVVPHNK